MTVKRGKKDHDLYINYNLLTPVFSFRYLDNKLIKNLKVKDWSEFIFKIKKLESIEWACIQTDSYKNGHGCEYIPRKQFHFNVPDEFMDKEKFAVFRYTQKGRIIGYRDERVFYVLWIDTKHESY